MKESILTDIFWHAGFILAISALIVPFLRYFKLPNALGYLLAGIALGPFALGAIATQYPFLNVISFDDTSHVKILAEIGIVLLLFVIGLEMTPSRLWNMRHLIFGLGGTQVLLSSSVIGLIAYLWGNSLQVSILLGLSLSLSSTAIVTQWLQEQKLFVNDTGRTSFSILLLQDIAVIPILLLLTILSSDTNDSITSFVFSSLTQMILTAGGIYIVGKIILKPIFLFANKHGDSEVFMALSLLVIIVSASIASIAGLSMGLGAFIAGILLADTQYRHEVSSLIIPFKSMLIGIFFISFGMSIDLSFIGAKPFWLFSAVIGLMTIKAIIIFILCKAWKQTTAVSVESALLLSQAGEFGLLVVGSSLNVGIMTQDIGQFMLLTIGITMILAPAIAPLSRKLGKTIDKQNHKKQPYHANKAEPTNNHVVIFGYGRVGQEIGGLLSKEGYTILGFDKNVASVNKAHIKNIPVYLGDATNQSTLKSASLTNALCVVITLDNAQDTYTIIEAIRKIAPFVPIVVRAHSTTAKDTFNNLNHVNAIAENILISKTLGQEVLNQCRLNNIEKESVTNP